MGFSKDRPLHISHHFMHSPLGMNPISGGFAGCQYELLARFDVANQGLANGQVMGAAEGVTVGNLTVVETDGTAEILNQVLRLSGQTVSSWITLGVRGNVAGIARTLGKTLFGQVQHVGAFNQCAFGWNDQFALASPINWEYALDTTITGVLNQFSDTSGDAQIAAYAVDTWYDLALVLGGQDASQQPWYSGAGGGPFTAGAAAFIKGGAFTDWTLIWRWANGTDTPLYATFNKRRIGGTVEADDIRVPTFDYSAAIQPVNADWFTDPNGTSLDVHVPDVGGMWTEHVGNFDIQSNRGSLSGSVNRSSATTQSNLADLFGRVSVNPQDGLSTSTARDMSFVSRFSDVDNYWFIGVNNTANAFRCVERNGTIETVRVSTVIAINVGTAYEITTTFDDTDIQGFLNGENRITFASAFNQAATRVGLRGMRTLGWFDNFHINRRTGTQYDILDECA